MTSRALVRIVCKGLNDEEHLIEPPLSGLGIG